MTLSPKLKCPSVYWTTKCTVKSRHIAASTDQKLSFDLVFSPQRATYKQTMLGFAGYGFPICFFFGKRHFGIDRYRCKCSNEIQGGGWVPGTLGRGNPEIPKSRNAEILKSRNNGTLDLISRSHSSCRPPQAASKQNHALRKKIRPTQLH